MERKGELLYQRFLNTAQETVRLTAALEGFFLEADIEESQRDAYAAYLKRRIRPAMERLIRENALEKMDVLEAARLGGGAGDGCVYRPGTEPRTGSGDALADAKKGGAVWIPRPGISPSSVEALALRILGGCCGVVYRQYPHLDAALAGLVPECAEGD